jgi:hypothetical protein
MKKQISAEIIADSINSQGNRLTTFVLVFPRIFNTLDLVTEPNFP